MPYTSKIEPVAPVTVRVKARDMRQGQLGVIRGEMSYEGLLVMRTYSGLTCLGDKWKGTTWSDLPSFDIELLRKGDRAILTVE